MCTIVFFLTMFLVLLKAFVSSVCIYPAFSVVVLMFRLALLLFAHSFYLVVSRFHLCSCCRLFICSSPPSPSPSCCYFVILSELSCVSGRAGGVPRRAEMLPMALLSSPHRPSHLGFSSLQLRVADHLRWHLGVPAHGSTWDSKVHQVGLHKDDLAGR